MKLNRRILAVVGATLALSAIGATQLKAVLKLVGVGAAVSKFGPDINKGINKLANRSDSKTVATKVVPILTAGLGGGQTIGAAQVMGSPAAVAKVTAVAQLEQDFFGKEVRLRAMIPISSKDVIKDIKAVPGVGVSGIVDLKL